ncbi:hypothetical protein [Bradyrhizobium iriomotense]|uniref:Tetratricopeptide repeat protein n=1 Tax=Bradyrhizobium iriomotense TaxID=441950 RepID=A0ABQ6ASS4_9BRAD|nr:hypothetical protein [Bradyrhizobium iriomotense]GLR85282.1 hypothetical protein GCM10007857_19920 [Bradyrhizobium iriomotense]
MRDPTQLRTALFGAVLTKNMDQLERLSAAYFRDIITNFSAWQNVPVELRDSEIAMQNWGRCLLTVAETLEGQGHPEAMQMLIGDSSDEEVWRTLELGLSQAEAFHTTGQFREELSVLSELVASFSRAPGSWNERIRAKLFASIATAHLELGELDDAYRSTRRALDECVNSGDSEGIEVYRKNLEFIDSKRLIASHDPEFMRRLIDAQRLSDSGQFDISNDRLQELLHQATGNPDHTRFLGKIWGLMGFNLFKSHDTLGARAFTAKALDACRSSKDAHGITVYEFNLAFIDKNIGARPNSTSS